MTRDAEIRRRPGGRSARVRQAVLEATLHAIRENGVEGVAIADVARRADVHETSIYRRWGTREKLILDALLSFSARQLPVPDTGSLRADLIAFLTELNSYLASPTGSALLRALASASADPNVAAARTAFWQERYELVRTMIDRSVARGEVRPDADRRLILEALIGPLHFRALMVDEPVDSALPASLVDLVLDGVAKRRS
jgi:AcrR family transcriptional regulator